MRLYNTMSRQVEDFQPINPPQVGLYACGFTVYDFTHLGHLRKYTMDDVLIRTLRQAGYQVKFVQNVTDVGHLTSDEDTGEDKLEKGAKKYGESVWDVAHKFEDYFFYSMDLMGNLRPDVSCRATEHIEAQLEMVKELESKGFTYVIEGDGVYFDTSKLDDYGKLARLNIEKLKEGARVEMVEGKRNITDFALWKFERPGENRAMVWPSPWHPRSFPGWHIECSAMGMQYLGEQFDIHTGGIDHIPVHHTNEIAQAEAATSKKPFVRYWVHHNFLRVDGEKMSKSLGNFFTVDDVLKKNFSPQALRLLFLMSHYRSQLNFTWESLAAAQKAWERLVNQFQSWPRSEVVLTDDQLSTSVELYRQRFFEYMNDDLKTPEAVALMWEVVGSSLAEPEKRYLLELFDQVLGLQFHHKGYVTSTQHKPVDISTLPDEVKALLEQRQQARQAQNWELSDSLRGQLAEMGYEAVDKAIGEVELYLS